SVLRAHFDVSGNAGKPLTVVVTRGATSLSLHDSVGGIAAVGTITPVSPEPIHIIGARQDLNLDAGGHKVSVLFNRPVSLAAGDDLLTKFSAQIALDRDGVSYRGSRPMSAAALQEGSRIANVTFDHALSQNATYSMNVAPLVDPLSGASVTFPDAVVPVIDNDSPGGIIFGHVLKGDNTPVPGADVQLYLDGNAGPPQYDTARDPDGSFLFEFVPRDIDNGIPGTYILRGAFGDKLTVINGAVRLPGRVHFVNLVFLGRGSAEGYVKYDNGDPVPGASVVVGSTLFDQFRTTTADANGHYTVGDLPVGPLTFSATDKDGNVTFAAGEIKTAGQLLQQNLSIFRRPFPGTGTIRGIVRRSDTNAAVVGAHVGVYSQGYGLIDGFTDAFGSFEFRKVPSGFVTVLASEWSISRESVALDFDLAADESRDVLLTLNVHPTEALVGIEGDVVREDPLHPGDSNFYQKVAGALVKIEKAQAVTADANGHFILTSIPVSFSGKNISAYDPITTRSATTVLPQLDPSKTNLVPIFISTASGYGEGTIRVRLLDAAGFPVTGYRVIVPGFPPFGPTVLDSAGSGVYQLQHVAVGSTTTIWAIGSGAAPYGDQTATGSAKVEFNGHVAALNLRLSGQGTVRVKLTADIDVIGDVKMTYPVWDEAEQGMSPKDFTASTSENGVAGYATFKSVPALQTFTASSQHPVYGYAAQSTRLGFDGDVQSITLQLNKLSIVRGTVYAIDGRTPVAGAAVRIEDGRQNPGIFTSLPDGTFEFRNVAAGVGIRVIAEVTQDGTYRTGMVSASTPSLGGPVNGLSLILRTQGGIDARIVYAGYKVFDPQNPANNVIDNTPNDLSDNAPVPLAKFVLRELDFPYRSFGTTADPLSADAAGRFSINNVFTGPLRVSASDPGNQETRGSWTGSISQEGERVTAIIGIGAEGFGPVNVSVVDPNAQNAPVINAEVSLLRSGFPFDLSTTDATGTVVFDQVPVGTYTVGAYSKSLGKSGSSGNFTVAAVTGAQVQVVLQFSGVVNGTLTDPEAGGRGVPGAPVTLTEQSFQTRASSDVAGNYIFNGVREGIFRLDTKDTLSNRRATASHELTQADPNPTVNLQLEPTDTLNLSVYLPDDSGGNSNVLAPIVNLDVTQRNGDFIRSLQGNHFQMPGLFRNEPYSVAIKEIGGNGREIHTSASFPLGSAANPLNLVLPAYGSVETHVIQGTTPAANAKVTVSGSSKSVTVYTDATGVAVAQGVPLGAVYVQVVSVDGAFSGSASATLTSQSTPTIVAITLGAYAGVSGLVDAETGGPSIGTRVIASFGRILEAITDSTGRFTFQGIPTGTRVDLTYMGPNDVTVGARQSVNVTIA
ncbi:MAG: carboxypeptidase regulatory-like domain-containing protein, partial [Thermoanaerobaculia bacterium]